MDILDAPISFWLTMLISVVGADPEVIVAGSSLPQGQSRFCGPETGGGRLRLTPGKGFFRIPAGNPGDGVQFVSVLADWGRRMGAQAKARANQLLEE